jgi:hypothetical protein
MSQRINPIGPTDRGAMPVQRVERRKPTPEEHEAGDGREAFDEQLEREMRDRGKRPPAEEPAVHVDLSTDRAPRGGAAGSRDGNPPPQADRGDGPHIDVSV